MYPFFASKMTLFSLDLLQAQRSSALAHCIIKPRFGHIEKEKMKPHPSISMPHCVTYNEIKMTDPTGGTTMPKITFMGAGSTVFAKNVLGDSMMTPALEESCIALYDIDRVRLDESAAMLEAHASAELSIDDIVAMCDELIEAHGDWMPKYH